MPLWKTTGFFLATFVLEDAAAIGAGLLLAAGAISWPAALISCWLGIWSGDTGLYLLARLGGRTWFAKSSWHRHAGPVARSKQWFARHGTLILVFSRCVPGARLPTYLAAGFLRLPLGRFLAVTGGAALLWTLFVLWLARVIGTPLLHVLKQYQTDTWFLLGGLAIAFGAVQLVRCPAFQKNLATRFARWRQWEFWPGWLFYPPVVFYCLWLAVKYRGLALPTLANPGIFSGGLVGESKFSTLKNLMETSPEFTAAASWLAARPDRDTRSLPASLTEETWPDQFAEPFILKPDIGQRGVGVKLIRTPAQAEAYFRQTDAPLLAQRYAPGPFEIGIFYYRFPDAAQGKIFSITEKIFPVITGDGHHTVRELIANDARARIIAEKYQQRFAARLAEILPAGETLKLVEAGNHAQGCIFRDGRHYLTPELEARIDEISRRLDGFFIGRYDLRFADEDDLRAGKNFQIIELNGAAAEATAIYDARNSVWSAYRTLFAQWNLVFAIGAENRRRGVPPTKVLAVWRAWRDYQRLAAHYPVAD